MSKITLSTVTSGQNLSNINNNFQAIADALNDAVLYRKNPTGEPNQMFNDMDMNGFNILNGNAASYKSVTLNGVPIEPMDIAIKNGLKSDNNLSDVASISTARFNLGLSNVDNTSDANKPVSTAQAAAIALKLDASLAASTYLSQVNAASTYLTQSNAASTYLTQTNAASTYATITNLALKAPIANASLTGTTNVQALTASGLITPSSTAGIAGTNTSNNANTGSIGEYVSANASSVAITSGVSTNITSISLTAGDWDVSGVMQVSPAGGTIVGGENISISTASATPGGLGSATFIGATKATGQADIIPTPVVRISIASTTTVYLVANVTYTTSTLTVSGLIRARRAR